MRGTAPDGGSPPRLLHAHTCIVHALSMHPLAPTHVGFIPHPRRPDAWNTLHTLTPASCLHRHSTVPTTYTTRFGGKRGHTTSAVLHRRSSSFLLCGTLVSNLQLGSRKQAFGHDARDSARPARKCGGGAPPGCRAGRQQHQQQLQAAPHGGTRHGEQRLRDADVSTGSSAWLPVGPLRLSWSACMQALNSRHVAAGAGE